VTFDLIITNCNIVTAQGVFKGTVSIDEGKIVAISSPSAVFDATKTIDARDGYLLPGVIDPHVHFGHPPKGFVKNLEDDQESLVNGGVTSVFSFIGEQEEYSKFIPPIIEGIHQNSLIDVGIHTVINHRDQLAGVTECAQKFGVTSIKFFIANKGGVQIYPSTWSVDDGTFYEGLRLVAKLGAPMLALAHCENWEIASMMADKLKAEGRTDQAAWSDSRPNICEEEAMRRASFLALRTKAPLYVVHISTREGPEVLREFREKGCNLKGEVCIHHLTTVKTDKLEVMSKYNPPIREREDVNALWKALDDGTLNTVGSDHICNRRKENLVNPDKPDIWNSWGGQAGSPFILPMLFHEGVSKGRLRIERIPEVISHNPARIFGLYPEKGGIRVGSDADLVIFDPSREVTITPELVRLSANFCYYTGQKVKGWPSVTIVRGEVVLQEGQIVANKGHGKYLRRTLSQTQSDI